MSDRDKKITVSVEELTLSNSLQLTAIVEVLEEQGILTRQQVVDQVRLIKERSRPQ
jgi:hypothetical protein